MEKNTQIYDKFLEEYGSEDAIRKYSTGQQVTESIICYGMITQNYI